MAITAGIVRITLRMTWLSQQVQTARDYEPIGAAWLTADAIQGAEAWWNHVKAAWRALAITAPIATFNSVLFEEQGGGGGFAEYAIPVAEQQGTRAAGTLGDFMPAFTAVGCKLTVATRATRPGQMRIPFAAEGDNSVGLVQPAFVALCNTLADLYDTQITLGAPVATGNLQPLVVTRQGSPPVIIDSQPIVGHVINPFFTSQVSRRPGHGS
jgi:hypothetical protein